MSNDIRPNDRDSMPATLPYSTTGIPSLIVFNPEFNDGDLGDGKSLEWLDSLPLHDRCTEARNIVSQCVSMLIEDGPS